MSKNCLFLDRDGVINIDHGYVCKIENFEFVAGIFELTKIAYTCGYEIAVVTNQAGIGRGYYSEVEFNELTAWMCKQFILRGTPISQVYFSPFHPREGIGRYKKNDFSRKLNPGMILLAQHKLNLDLSKSIWIGDKASDIKAGIAVGVGTNILIGDSRAAEVPPFAYRRIASLAEAIIFFNWPPTSREI